MGRLRRDGRAIYCSLDTLRYAATGVASRQNGGPEPGSLRDVSMTMLRVTSKGVSAAKAASLLEERRQEVGLVKRCASLSGRLTTSAEKHELFSTESLERSLD